MTMKTQKDTILGFAFSFLSFAEFASFAFANLKSVADFDFPPVDFILSLAADFFPIDFAVTAFGFATFEEEFVILVL